MSDVKYIAVSAEDAGQRLDNFLIKILKGVPKSYIYRIIRGGEVRVNKKRTPVHYKLQLGDSIRVPPIRMSSPKEIFVHDGLANTLKKSIIFEDASLMVINKPSGMAVHGGSGLSLGVIEALRKMRGDLNYLELVHRLDKETSGCLLLAKKRSMLRALHRLLEDRMIKKRYWALLCGTWDGKKSRLITAPLEKNQLQSGERLVKVDASGKASQTEYDLLENFDQACLVQASPKTGRTHQIRVHSAYFGHVIIGDEKYGYQKGAVEALKHLDNRLYLHARAVEFELDEKKYHFQADVDERFASALSLLQLRSLGNHEKHV